MNYKKRSIIKQEIVDILNENAREKFFDVNFSDVADIILLRLETVNLLPPLKRDPVLLREIREWDKE